VALRQIAGQKICILTPGHLSTNPRLVKEADALAEAGYDVQVIAADFIAWARNEDRSFKDRPWNKSPKLQFGPDAPFRTRAIQALRQQAARQMVGAGVRWPSLVQGARHPITHDLIAAAKRVSADLYIAHYTAALPAAAIAARHRGGLYAFDAEDFHPGDWPFGPSHAVERDRLRMIEERYLPGCAYVTAASPGIAKAYADTYGIRKPEVLLNVFPLSHAPSGPTQSGTTQPGPSLYWFSQTIGPDRGLECAVRAIRLASSKPHLYLRGNPSAGFAELLYGIASDCGVKDRMHLLPPATPSEMERLAAAYDVGLAGETGHTQNRQIALTNKLFSYLLAGIPALLSDIPAHRAFACDAGPAVHLYAVDDPASLAKAVDRLLSDTATLAATRAAAFSLGQARFNWDYEKAVLLKTVSKALNSSLLLNASRHN